MSLGCCVVRVFVYYVGVYESYRFGEVGRRGIDLYCFLRYDYLCLGCE